MSPFLFDILPVSSQRPQVSYKPKLRTIKKETVGVGEIEPEFVDDQEVEVAVFP